MTPITDCSYGGKQATSCETLRSVAWCLIAFCRNSDSDKALSILDQRKALSLFRFSILIEALKDD